jgi:hypothetical protein
MLIQNTKSPPISIKRSFIIKNKILSYVLFPALQFYNKTIHPNTKYKINTYISIDRSFRIEDKRPSFELLLK